MAFYKGGGDWRDRVIRTVTASSFSHVELVWISEPGWPERPILSISASPRDGGVRSKLIDFNPFRWEMVQVRTNDPAPWAFAEAQIGALYDWPGVILRHGMGLPLDHGNRWFCSELCAAAIGLENARDFSPGSLYETVANGL